MNSVVNPSDPLQQPLSQEELGKLESFLASDLTPEESLSSIEMLDGYMTALIVGPDVIHPDVWMPYIWNQENNAEPVFSSEAEARVIWELLVRHMNTIALQFHEDPEGFVPLFETFSYDGEEQHDLAIENWSLGFTMGMELNHESWKPLFADEESGMLAMPMLILSKITDDYDSLSKNEIIDMIDLLPDFVIRIYSFWKQDQE